jgi:PAS domain S-box-containing protein
METKNTPPNNLAEKYIDVAEVMLLVINADETVSHINRKGCNLLGYEEKEVIGKNWFDNFLPEKIRKEIREVFNELLNGRVSLLEYYSNPVLTKSGKEKNIAWHNTVMQDEKGRVICTVSSGEDVTEREAVKAQVRQAKYEWEEVFDSIADIITIHDKDFNIVRYNKAAEKVLKMPLLKDMHVKCYEVYHGTESPPEECPSCECLRTRKAHVFEMFEPYLNKFVEIRAIPRFDENGQLSGLIHIVRDISKRRRIEDEILSVSNIPAENPNPVIRISSDKTILYTNDSFNRLLTYAGFSEGEAYKILPDNLYELIDTALESGKPHIMLEAKVADKTISYNIIPIMERAYVNLYGRDVSDHKKAEKEVQKKVADLEKFYDMAVGRELKMKELKKEVKLLRARVSRYKMN